MATEPTEPQIGPEPVRFRPSKKRKVYRQRTDNDDDQDADTHEPTQSRAVAADYFDADQGPTDPTVVKVRNANRGRLRGVGFRAGSRPGDVETTGHALVVRDHQDGQSSLTVAGIADKFTHQTGLLSDLNDKHMNEYIESRLSSRATAQHGEPEHAQDNTATETIARTDANAAESKAPKQPVMHGKLMEVDIPTSATPVSSRPGETSPRRAVAQAPGQADGATKKQRLGPDGRPWRSRKRRGSDDIKRDQLVEEFLHENRLDVYDVPEPQPGTGEGDGDGDADERLAEEFRRQFMEDVAARQKKKKKPAQQAGKPGAEEVLKGPKLGGSRNVRAAVRDMLLKKEREGKR